ncbi:MAG TPA: DUF2076 domain-containing protein [Xanthobacteraceae bacterium]|jgi:hypothetical protein|nr:DUF2076 domain-containing protein [Xanthobacteraceae bacterium]
MTPQERQLVAELFDRLAALESAPRDRDAEHAVMEGLRQAPHATYALVQTVLVQDEALKAANAHIQELEAAVQNQAGVGGQPQGGFLDTMRDSLFGRRDEPHAGSVPSINPSRSVWGTPPGFRQDTQPSQMASSPSAPAGGGGSFLGTAAAAAAGMIGGGLMLDGIRSMLGGQHHGPFAGAFDHISSGGVPRETSPWSSGGSDDLSQQAGLNDIGRDRSAGFANVGNNNNSEEPFDIGQNDAPDDDFGDDDGYNGGDDGSADV